MKHNTGHNSTDRAILKMWFLSLNIFNQTKSYIHRLEPMKSLLCIAIVSDTGTGCHYTEDGLQTPNTVFVRTSSVDHLGIVPIFYLSLLFDSHSKHQLLSEHNEPTDDSNANAFCFLKVKIEV
jgi:hypothetical protein